MSYSLRPDVRFFCDVTYDPFIYMEEHDKVYGEFSSRRELGRMISLEQGFTISLVEWEPTIPTLWSTVKGLSASTFHSGGLNQIVTSEFIAEHPQYVSPQNSMNYLSDNGGETYNLCHCESTRANGVEHILRYL